MTFLRAISSTELLAGAIFIIVVLESTRVMGGMSALATAGIVAVLTSVVAILRARTNAQLAVGVRSRRTATLRHPRATSRGYGVL